MPINVTCPGCKAPFAVDDALVGKKIRCKGCQTVVAVPAAAPAPKPTPAPKPATRPMNADEDVFAAKSAPRTKAPAPPSDEEDEPLEAEPVAPARSSRSAAKPAAPVRAKGRPVTVDDDDLDEVPAPRSPRKPAKKGSALPLLIGGLVVGGVLLAAVGGGIAYALYGTGSDTPVAATRPEDSSPATQPEETAPATRPAVIPPTKPDVTATRPETPTKPQTPATKPEVPATKPEPATPPPVVLDRLTEETVNRVKRSTVFFKVKDNEGTSFGSGFFGVEPGIVVTNAHVLGMLSADSRPPASIEIILNKGERDQISTTGEILAVERDRDLAVLRITSMASTALPPPLPVAESDGRLGITQNIWTVGFPLGEAAGNEVSVRKSSVSAFRRGRDGQLEKVQMEGGADPGNSGGPVIDASGTVVGVTVSGIKGTAIAYAIPGEHVLHLLNGRIREVAFAQPYLVGEEARADVTVLPVDPLNRLKEVRLAVWAGPKGTGVRPVPKGSEPGREADDTPHTTFTARKTGDKWAAEVKLPALSAGQVYWFRPAYVEGGGKVRWLSASTLAQTGPPVERKPANLTVVHTKGAARNLELTHKSHLTARGKKDEAKGVVVSAQAKMTEFTEAVRPGGEASNRLQYTGMNFSIKADGDEAEESQQLQSVLSQLLQCSNLVTVDKQGKLVKYQANMNRAQPSTREALELPNQNVMESMETLCVPLPNGEVEPLKTWEASRPMVIMTPTGKARTVSLNMKYTYLGRRVREGRQEAVIALEGTMDRSGEGTFSAAGKTTGTALVDLASGTVTLARATSEIDFEYNLPGRQIKVAGTTEMQLSRSVATTR